jgi:sec-independent protein translocase protein TatB
MLDFGFSEIVVTSMIALVVLGPKRLPGVMRKVGNWMGRARVMARQLSDQLEREINAEELLRETQKKPAAPPAAATLPAAEPAAAAPPEHAAATAVAQPPPAAHLAPAAHLPPLAPDVVAAAPVEAADAHPAKPAS